METRHVYNNLVEVARFSNATQADLARAYLESQGIKCVMYDSIMNQLFGGAIEGESVRLSVDEGAEADAIEVLKQGGYEQYRIVE